jgi:protein SCO1/2
MTLTPDGRVSRYLYGVRYKERDLRLALAEASEGKLGSMGDKLLLFCFHYDPEAKGYVPFARNLMKLAGGLMVVVMGIGLTFLFRRERGASLPPGVATVK